MVHSGMRIHRIFKCDRCSLEHRQKTVSLVIRCKVCSVGVMYDRDFDPEYDELDWYSERKLWWIQHPEAHYEHIRQRAIDGKDAQEVRHKGERDRQLEKVDAVPI